MRRRPLRSLTAASSLALALAACGADGTTPSPSAPTALPSGGLGIVTQETTSAAVLGLCEVLSGLADDPETAMDTFHDRVHEELHVIAAATQTQDRAAAAALLQAKEKVEADFAGRDAADAGDDVEALAAALRDALDAIGLAAPDCPA